MSTFDIGYVSPTNEASDHAICHTQSSMLRRVFSSLQSTSVDAARPAIDDSIDVKPNLTSLGIENQPNISAASSHLYTKQSKNGNVVCLLPALMNALKSISEAVQTWSDNGSITGELNEDLFFDHPSTSTTALRTEKDGKDVRRSSSSMKVVAKKSIAYQPHSYLMILLLMSRVQAQLTYVQTLNQRRVEWAITDRRLASKRLPKSPMLIQFPLTKNSPLASLSTKHTIRAMKILKVTMSLTF